MAVDARSRPRWLKPVAALGIAIAIVVLVVTSGLAGRLDLDELKQHQDALQAWIADHRSRARGGFFLAYVLVAALSIPGAAVMTLAAGALFGGVTGTLLVSFASTLGATIAFLVARYLLRDAVHARFGERLARIDAGIARDGAFYLFTLRLVPVFPFVVVNLLAGLTRLRTWTYAWVSQLGMLPATMAYVFAGTRLALIESPGDVLSPGLLGAFLVIGLLPLATRWLARALQRRRAHAGHRRPRRFEYNLLVVGAGSAGLVAAYVAAAAGAKVALVEKHRMGGDCLNTGCVPSKALIRTARLLAEARDCRRHGVARMDVHFDFAAAMERVQQVIARIAPHDSVERYRELGVDVVQGDARLVSPWEVEVGDRRMSARAIVIASGARPLLPDLPGLAAAAPLTSDTVWSLRDLPRRLLVLGGGPVGCELAQVFARFGSHVHLVEQSPRLLPREDADAAAAVAEGLRIDGVSLAVAHTALRVEADADGHALVCRTEEGEIPIGFDRILVALGRKANVEGFGLEELGIELDERGTIAADALMRTNVANIHVAGDATSPLQFTHVASHQAWHAAFNALVAPFWRFKLDDRVVPWVTFTDPEVARVGLGEDEARRQDIDVEVTRYDVTGLDRAIADGNGPGFVKVLTPVGKDRILGATVVGAHAGEVLPELVLAMKHGIGLRGLLGTIHAYPTMAEANRRVAGMWRQAHVPGRAIRWAGHFFRWRRG